MSGARSSGLRFDVFPRMARAWLAFSVLVAALAWWSLPTPVGLLLVLWLVVRSFSVPQRWLLVEASAMAALSVGLVRGVPTGAGAFLVGLAFLEGAILPGRPEIATQPLVGFDLCHLLLTSPIRPSTSHHFLELAAPMDRALLIRALDVLIADVARLRSFVREAPLGLQRFVAPRLWVEPATLVEWHEAVVDPVEEGWFERPIDVTTTPPVRLFHAPRKGGGHLFGLTLHHSVADGTGAMLLLDGLMRRYDNLRGIDVDVPTILSVGPRCRRLVWRHGVTAVLAMLVRAMRHTTRRVQSASLVDDPAPRPARFGLQLVDVPAPSWRAVIAAASVSGCTPNHFLMAASLLAADAVRRTRNLGDETFRVIVPSDLRTLFGLPRSLPNYIGTVPLEITPAEVREAELPTKIRTRVRDGRSGAAQMCFPIQIGLIGLLPPSMARRILREFDQDPRTFAFSFLFSHIRVPRDLHLPTGHEVGRLWCASSQGRQPAFGVAITTLRERTWMLVQYLSPYVAREAVEQFSRELLVQLARLTKTAAVSEEGSASG
jgi:NRPS condensation-like uncharacterized protein